MPKRARQAWTPYGLEHIRAAHIRRKRILQALLLLGLLILAASLFSVTTTTQNQIFDGQGNRLDSGIKIDAGSNAPKKDHVTVAVSPGRASRADTGGDPTAASTITRSDIPSYSTAAPINFAAYLMLYGPYALVALAAWFLAKRRSKHDEVNFGVYKGAMPLEMITAAQDRDVFTKKHVKQSVFGKGRLDHLPREVASIAREDGP